MSFYGGPAWFVKLFPLGCGVMFGPHDTTRFTRLEAAVFFLRVTRGWSEHEAFADHIPVGPEKLAAVKAALEEKYRRYQDQYAAHLGTRVIQYGRLFR